MSHPYLLLADEDQITRAFLAENVARHIFRVKTAPRVNQLDHHSSLVEAERTRFVEQLQIEVDMGLRNIDSPILRVAGA